MSRCTSCQTEHMRSRRAAGKENDRRQHHRSGSGDAVCTCTAYVHAHRQFGGRCSLLRWVKEFFDPLRNDCRGCLNATDDGQCEVVNKVEAVWHCPALRDYVRFEGITLYGRAAEQKAQSEGGR